VLAQLAQSASERRAPSDLRYLAWLIEHIGGFEHRLFGARQPGLP